MNCFHALYPDISVSLLLVDNVELDLSLRQADVAIRTSRGPLSGSLVGQRVGRMRMGPFASPSLVERMGARPLGEWPFIGWIDGPGQEAARAWLEAIAPGWRAHVHIDSPPLALDLQGGGS